MSAVPSATLRAICFCCAALLVPCATYAATYYVRKSGSDGAAGTSPATAWATLGRAVATAGAGDRVVVGAGTYSEQVTLATSGASGSPLQFAADTGGTETGDAGPVIIEGGTYGIYADSVSYVALSGFIIEFASADGVRLEGACTGWDLSGLTVRLHNGSGIALDGGPGPALLQNVSIRDCVLADNFGDGLSIVGNVYGVDCLRCVVYQNGSAGIAVGADTAVPGDLLLEANRIDNNWSNGIEVQAVTETVRIYNNVIYDNVDGIQVPLTAEGGAPLDLEIAFNTIAFNEDGVWIEATGSNTGVVLVSNVFYRNTRSAVDLKSGLGLICDFNCLWQNPYAGLVASGAADIVASPMLADPDGADDLRGGDWGADDDFRLRDGSPCVDAGNPVAGVLLDAAGNPRVLDVLGIDRNGSLEDVDIGAYELAATGFALAPASVRLPLLGVATVDLQASFMVAGVTRMWATMTFDPAKLAFGGAEGDEFDVAGVATPAPGTVVLELVLAAGGSNPQGVVLTAARMDWQALHDRGETAAVTLTQGAYATATTAPVLIEVAGVATTLAVNALPSISLVTPAGEQSGNVTLSYMLADADSDVQSVVFAYSQNGGTSWAPATLGPGGDGTTGLASTPGGMPHTIVWDSLADLGATDQTDIRVRLTPTDFEQGATASTGNFHVDNNQPPAIVIRAPYSAPLGHAEIPYQLFDAEGDPCSVVVAFRRLEAYGGPFQPATWSGLGEGTTGLAAGPAGVDHVFVWHAAADLVFDPYSAIIAELRFTPADIDPGDARISSPIVLVFLPSAVDRSLWSIYE